MCSPFHRLYCIDRLCDFGWPVCTTAFWDEQCWLTFCSSHVSLALMHQWDWFLQHYSLEPRCCQSFLSTLYLLFFQKDWNRWMEFSWRNYSLHYRFVSFISFDQFSFLSDTDLTHFVGSGAEAMFADLGHFSQVPIRVSCISYFHVLQILHWYVYQFCKKLQWYIINTFLPF